MMKKFLIATLFLFASITSYAAVDQNDRRIEEEKRKSLKSTEAQYYDPQRSEIRPEKDPTRQYLNRLLSEKAARMDDAVYVMTTLLGELDELKSYDEQLTYLIENDIVPPEKKGENMKEQPLRRGYFAYMLFKALGLKGGLTLRVFGPSQRYAHQELVYEGVMLSGSSNEIMTGRELVYSFVRAVDYIARNNQP